MGIFLILSTIFLFIATENRDRQRRIDFEMERRRMYGY